MPDTFELISAVRVGSGGTSGIDFTSIPQGYTDLVIKLSLRTNRAEIADNIKIWFNNSTSNHSNRVLVGTGSGVTSTTDTGIYPNVNGDTSTSNAFSNIEVYIPSYSGSSNKSLSIDAVTEHNGTLAYANLMAGLWAVTTAINQITILPYTGTALVQNSTAYLYGIKNS
jgi:accessory colonization factor AcfC